jgi:hypothetical protein
LDSYVPEDDHILADVLSLVLTNPYMVQTVIEVKEIKPSAEAMVLQKYPEEPIYIHPKTI